MNTLTQTLARLFIPNSLSTTIAQERLCTTSHFTRVAPRLSKLQQGDLILVKTPGRIYSVLREITSQPYDHLAIIITCNHFLHIGPPNVRLLPIELLLGSERQPYVLRPNLTENQKENWIRNLRALEGQPYDLLKVYGLVAKLVNQKKIRPFSQLQAMKALQILQNANLANDKILNLVYSSYERLISKRQELVQRVKALRTVTVARRRHICTDTILNTLCTLSDSFREARDSLDGLSYSEFKSWSIADLVMLAEKRPDLLRRIELPNIEDEPSNSLVNESCLNRVRMMMQHLSQNYKNWGAQLNQLNEVLIAVLPFAQLTMTQLPTKLRLYLTLLTFTQKKLPSQVATVGTMLLILSLIQFINQLQRNAIAQTAVMGIQFLKRSRSRRRFRKLRSLL